MIIEYFQPNLSGCVVLHCEKIACSQHVARKGARNVRYHEIQWLIRWDKRFCPFLFLVKAFGFYVLITEEKFQFPFLEFIGIVHLQIFSHYLIWYVAKTVIPQMWIKRGTLGNLLDLDCIPNKINVLVLHSKQDQFHKNHFYMLYQVVCLWGSSMMFLTNKNKSSSLPKLGVQPAISNLWCQCHKRQHWLVLCSMCIHCAGIVIV